MAEYGQLAAIGLHEQIVISNTIVSLECTAYQHE